MIIFTIEILYCSNLSAINQQQWPITNRSNPIIQTLSKASYPGATMQILHVNFLERAIFLDLSSPAVLNAISAITIGQSSSCVQWFGSQYPTSTLDVYSLPISPQKGFSTKDSMYTTEILSGWLDVLSPFSNGITFTSVIGKQAVSLARSFATFQMRPWYLVLKDSSVLDSQLGSVEHSLPLDNANSIAVGKIPYFKSATQANGILDTIEPRWFAKVIANPVSLGGYEQIPFFQSNFTSEKNMDDYISSKIEATVTSLAAVDLFQIGTSSSDLELAQAIGNLQTTIGQLPYGAMKFDKIDHISKSYSYTLQFGTDARLKYSPGLPSVGLRMLLGQAQLSNGILRFSDPNLANTVITQGTRAFPTLAKADIAPSFDAIIGKVLYPLGISFLLPVFTSMLVRDKETNILAMLRMVSKSCNLRMASEILQGTMLAHTLYFF